MYILQYDYVALLLNIINLLVFIKLKKLRDPKSGVLLGMLTNSLLTTIFDILSALTIGNPNMYSQAFATIVTNIYYLLNNNKVYIYIIYVLLLVRIDNRFSNIKKIFIILPYFVTSIMILINIFTGIVFSIDSNNVYHREVGLVILYIIAFLYLLLWSLYSYKYIKEMEHIIFRAFASLVIIYIICSIVQTLYPQYLIQSFGTAMSELIIIMILQNRKDVIHGGTQLYNQNAFYDKLKSKLVSNTSTSVILIILEDTARISYTLGYSYLTNIIQEVARFIKFELKAKECYYIRNSCFAVLCSNPSDKECLKMMEKLTNKFKENWRFNGLSINLSIRTSRFLIPEHINSYSILYDYIKSVIASRGIEDKNTQTEMTEISLNTHFRELQVRKAITLAMERNSFEVYYQPIYSVRDKCFVSAEALARLRDPELGFIPPDEFIPITEQDGTITILGMQIFETVCNIYNQYELDKRGIHFIEVNLSVVQCKQKDIMEQLTAIMKANKINPKQICLEITETVAIHTPEIVHNLFHELDQLGMKLALDDYGSGYSNINYILELPFHFVKLDKEFFWNYFKNDAGKVVLEGNIAMMKALNIELIAEGVETKEQADTLIKLGVDYLQGYYYSRPIPAEDFIKFIEEENNFIR